MKSLTMLMLFLAFNTHAFDVGRFEKDTCGRVLVDRGNGFYSVRAPLIFQGANEGTVVMQKVNAGERPFFEFYDTFGTYRLQADLKSVQDFVVYRGDLWVLSEGNLLQFDDKGVLLNSFRYPHNGKHEEPMGMDVRNGKLIIAHGKLGLVSFNIKEQEFSFLSAVNTWQQDGRRSKAVAVTWQGKILYTALTGLQQGAFNGIVVYDIEENVFINEARYRNGREGVIDPRAKIYSHEGKIYLNNGGWIHHLQVDDLQNRTNARPRWLAIPYQHGNLNRYLTIRGDFLFNKEKISGCAINERQPVFATRDI